MASAAYPPFERQGGELFQLVWPFTSPLRRYASGPPSNRLKTFVLKRLLPKVFPAPPAHLLAELPGGGRIRIEYSDEIALLLLVNGGYEAAELHGLPDIVPRGSTVIDVGANIGMYAIALAGVVGDAGRVLAFEPVPATAARLRDNLALNGYSHVDVLQMAAGGKPGSIEISLANDSAYASAVNVKQQRATGESIRVPTVRLDDVWEERGRPPIAFCKIDVEGGELSVLEGAERLLSASRPTLLLEADEGPELERLTAWLGPRGYRERREPGFLPWNHLFVAR
jgi:FkbM family methyltransferase